MKENKKTSRDSNIELLRIVLMFMIVAYHLLIHGTDLKGMATDTYQVTDSTPYKFLLNSFLIVGVNCYIFITGYYGIRFKTNSVIRMVWQALFYSIGILAVFSIFSLRHVGIKDIILGLLPVSTGAWWFLTTYLFLFLLSPLLNTAFSRLTQQQFLHVLVVLTVLNCFVGFVFDPFGLGTGKGYSLISFIYIYSLGRYLKQYPEATRRFEKYSFAVYLICTLMIFTLSMAALGHVKESLVWRIFSYNNPLIMLSAVALFFGFRRLSFSSSLVNNVSQYTFGVYLIHDHAFIREQMEYLASRFLAFSSLPLYFLSLLLVALCILVVCLFIEGVRYKFFAAPPKLIYRFINVEKYDSLINLR